ncbi:hypothetical protein E24_00338 [Faustovirus]|nr:hypothetical protein PRJ_Fausto_00320 [Faustovirus]AMN83256.1 hypothetical protein E24_00338 [Faustovirus]AMN84239.1 hypothetical protein D5a_00336 [Faustovirus]AMN85227.1 hypothetical protein E23_00338 [Faustovirus]QBR99227.1 hypothetical protein [Faustovirus mariensis]
MAKGKSNSKSQRKSQRKSKNKSAKKRKGSKTILPKPTKGALGDYTTKSPASKRRKSLQKQVREKDYATVIKELNLRAVLNKNTAPEASKKISNDMKYLKQHRH